jgi:hypothetical protein
MTDASKTLVEMAVKYLAKSITELTSENPNVNEAYLDALDATTVLALVKNVEGIVEKYSNLGNSIDLLPKPDKLMH